MDQTTTKTARRLGLRAKFRIYSERRRDGTGAKRNERGGGECCAVEPNAQLNPRSAYRTCYHRGVIRESSPPPYLIASFSVSFQRRFFGAQSGQTRRLVEVGQALRPFPLARPGRRLNSFIPRRRPFLPSSFSFCFLFFPFLLFFSLDAPPGTNGRAVSGSTFNFRLTSLSLLRDPPRTAPRRFDVRKGYENGRVIARARARDAPPTVEFVSPSVIAVSRRRGHSCAISSRCNTRDAVSSVSSSGSIHPN